MKSLFFDLPNELQIKIICMNPHPLKQLLEQNLNEEMELTKHTWKKVFNNFKVFNPTAPYLKLP